MTRYYVVAALLLCVLAGRAQPPDEKPPAADGKQAPDKKQPVVDDKEAMKRLLDRAEEEYRLYFKRPEKVPEFWAAINFEITVGKFDLAALHLKRLLEKQPPDEVDQELLKVEEVKGMSTFLRLQTIRKWSTQPTFQKEAEKNVETLINRVTTALEKHLSDPERLTKFIGRLDAPTIEERAYAFMQVNRSRARAATYLIKALKANMGQPLYNRIVEAMVRLDPELMPGLLEVLKARSVKDAQDVDLRVTLLDIVKRRAETRAIPYLWHLSASAMYPPLVRSRARDTLVYLLSVAPDGLPPAAMALTELAEKYYRQKVKFADPKNVKVWPWDGQAVATQPVALTAVQADEYFGLRYAREALELDPAYQPAQIVFLNLTLNYTYAFEPDQFFLKKTPAALQQLLATIDFDLLQAVLERGLTDGNLRIILPIVQALGERGDVRVARPSHQGPPRGVVRALYYPDRRVQFAAVRAMLKMPATTVPVASTRIVEILRRFLAADPEPRALVAFAPKGKANEIRLAVKASGFEPVLVGSVREAFEHLSKSADFDAIVLFPPATAGELPYVLAQMRGDRDSGLLPLLVFTDGKTRAGLPRLAANYRNLRLVPDVVLTMPEELKGTIENAIKESGGAKLSDKERKEFTRVALDFLWRMARKEIQGYDIRPAQDAIVQAVASKDLAVEAIEILGRLPGTDVQQRLGAVVLDATKGKLRLTAALELNRHIQRYGVVLNNQQLKDLRAAYRNPMEDADVRAQLAIAIGSLRPTPQQTGARLTEFQPSAK